MQPRTAQFNGGAGDIVLRSQRSPVSSDAHKLTASRAAYLLCAHYALRWHSPTHTHIPTRTEILRFLIFFVSLCIMWDTYWCSFFVKMYLIFKHIRRCKIFPFLSAAQESARWNTATYCWNIYAPKGIVQSKRKILAFILALFQNWMTFWGT